MHERLAEESIFTQRVVFVQEPSAATLLALDRRYQSKRDRSRGQAPKPTKAESVAHGVPAFDAIPRSSLAMERGEFALLATT